MSNFSRFKDILEYMVLYFSIIEKTHIEIECILYMQPDDNLPPRTTATAPPAACLAEGLADDHRDRLLAVPRDCPLKIKFGRGGNAENLKSALCGLYGKYSKINMHHVYCIVLRAT